MKAKLTVIAGMTYLFLTKATGFAFAQPDDVIQVSEGDLGFSIPNLSQFMSFMIRFFFVLAGLMALFYMLWGALEWVTSGGDSGKVDNARKKIIAAVIGVIMIIATLAVVVALEQVVFKGAVCFGLSCPLTLPAIIQKAADRCLDYDNDGLPNATDPDTDGDELCNDGGTDADANPNKKAGQGRECDQTDDNDDQDGLSDSAEPDAAARVNPCLP